MNFCICYSFFKIWNFRLNISFYHIIKEWHYWVFDHWSILRVREYPLIYHIKGHSWQFIPCYPKHSFSCHKCIIVNFKKSKVLCEFGSNFFDFFDSLEALIWVSRVIIIYKGDKHGLSEHLVDLVSFIRELVDFFQTEFVNPIIEINSCFRGNIIFYPLSIISFQY